MDTLEMSKSRESQKFGSQVYHEEKIKINEYHDGALKFKKAHGVCLPSTMKEVYTRNPTRIIEKHSCFQK